MPGNIRPARQALLEKIGKTSGICAESRSDLIIVIDGLTRIRDLAGNQYCSEQDLAAGKIKVVCTDNMRDRTLYTNYIADEIVVRWGRISKIREEITALKKGQKDIRDEQKKLRKDMKDGTVCIPNGDQWLALEATHRLLRVEDQSLGDSIKTLENEIKDVRVEIRELETRQSAERATLAEIRKTQEFEFKVRETAALRAERDEESKLAPAIVINDIGMYQSEEEKDGDK